LSDTESFYEQSLEIHKKVIRHSKSMHTSLFCMCIFMYICILG